ncbi:MAG: trypsin-like peptidase domain-containing protein [Bacteroidales bacterium]|nr:trypsin-like peptidase domain-containing protein [Bacteroidales bacterium]
MRKLAILFIAVFIATGFTKSQTVSELYQQVHPSVVIIYTQEQVPLPGLIQKTTTSEGIGSGVLLTEEGDILTAAHVVHNAEHIVVGFSDGTKVTAKIIASVEMTDIAHIKLDWVPENRTIGKLGNSDEVAVGEQVFVIGAPYGIERSLSVGHVSGRHSRESLSAGLARIELLQTDAAINRGNSGGPMFNMDGEVIGVVSYILSESGGFEGIGFAVSSAMVKELLVEQSSFWTGFEGVLLDEGLVAILNVNQGSGILIQRVVNNSPAFEMGLRGGIIHAIILEKEIILGGDIILSVNGIKIDSIQEVGLIRQNLISLNPGDKVTMKVLRAGKIIELSSNKFITN